MIGNGSSSQQTLISSPIRSLRLVVVCGPCFLSDALGEALKADSAGVEIRVGCGLEAVVRLACDGAVEAILLDGERGNLAMVGPIRAGAPGIPIIVLGLKETVEEIIPWAEAGVIGYISATTGLNDLLPLVRAVISGDQPCSGRIAAALLRRLAAKVHGSISGNGLPRTAEFTRREREIAELVSAGLSDKEISRRLSIGLATTRSHVHNLLRKLNVGRRYQVSAVWRDPEQQSGGPPYPHADPFA